MLGSAIAAMTKLSAAEHAAFVAKPASSSVRLPPLALVSEAMRRMNAETATAPKKAKSPVPSSPHSVPMPATMASTAPRLAPEEMPSK